MQRNIYKEGTIRKVRFESPQGKTNLTIEQLYDLPLKDDNHRIANLNDIAILLNEQKVEVIDFINDTSSTDELAKLKFDIVLDVIKTKKELQRRTLEAQAKKEHARKVLQEIEAVKAGKIVKGLKKMSGKELEELQKEMEQTLLNK